MLRAVVHLLVFIFSCGTLKAIGVDSVYNVRKTPFLTDLIGRSNIVYPFPHANLIPVNNGQMIIKTPKNLYIAVVNTGILFKYVESNDSTVLFRRIDRTVATGYNVGALYFTQGEDLYNFGGYGFWKNNGTLRKYNFKDAEWDVQPLSEEVIPQIISGAVVWHDYQHQKLYVPFERIINAGVTGSENIAGVIKRNAYLLDLASGIWKSDGSVSRAVLNLYTDGFLGPIFNFEGGQILIHNYELYWIDFQGNRVNACTINSYVQSFNRLTRNYPFRYIYEGMYYCFDPSSNAYDSIPLNLSLFQPTGDRVTETYTRYAYLIIPFTLLISLFLIIRHRRTKRLTTTKPAETSPVQSVVVGLNFDEPENRLLKLLIQKGKSNMRCTIEEINYTLGLKDKNQGLQKKMRSDIINGINQKYRIFSGNDLSALIVSIRSEQDKRYFEYYLDPEKLAEIESLLI